MQLKRGLLRCKLNTMGKTPRSRIKGMLRQIFLRSAERSEALKRDHYTCCDCGIKQSKKKDHVVKVNVHHKKGIKIWDQIIDLIYSELLCDVDDLETLCVECHDKQ